MTVEAFEAASPATIVIGATYDIPWPYIEGGVIAVVIHDGERVVLEPADYVVDPITSDADGTLTLTPEAAAIYEGGSLIISRQTPLEQGWQGILGYRERGLERQLDATVMRVQELTAELQTAFRVDVPVPPMAPAPGRVIGWSNDGEALVSGPLLSDLGAAVDVLEDAETAAEQAVLAADVATAASAAALARIDATYPTVAAMVADTGLIMGSLVRVLGYHAPGDGGENVYAIVNSGTGVVDGGSFIALTGISGQARGLFPNGDLCPMQFGAVGDGVANDRAAFLAMFAYGALIGSDPFWDEGPLSSFPVQITYTGRNRSYCTSAPIPLDYGQRNCILRDFTMKAIAGTWATAGGTPTTERENYRPQKSSFIFEAEARATFINITNCVFNCNNLCGGVSLSSRSTISHCFIKRCAGVGVQNIGGDVYVSHCRIYQWLSSDVEFFDRNAYTGVGIMSTVSDLRVDNCVIAYMHELIRLENTNCHVWGGHLFNGCNPYKAVDRDDDDALDEALRVYFGFATLAEVRAHDFPTRQYNAGVVTAGGPGLDFSFNGVYLDNCHNEHYSDRVVWISPKVGHHASSTHPDMRLYWWNFYCHTNEADPRFRILDAQMLVQSGAKNRLFEFSSHNGNNWGQDYTWLENTAPPNRLAPSSRRSDGVAMVHPYTHFSPSDGGREPAITFAAPMAGSFIGFYDNTTATTGGVPDTVRVGAVGNSFQSRAFQHTFRSRDGLVDHLTITANGTLRFTSHPSEPTSQNGDLARSDGTPSTNGFGTAGAGLYFKVAGTWVKL